MNPARTARCPGFPGQKSSALPFPQEVFFFFFYLESSFLEVFSIRYHERVCTIEASAGFEGITKSDIYFC